MGFKVSIIIFCVGFYGLLCDGRNPYEGESLASMYDVGELKVQKNSPRRWEATWKFGDFFSLPQYRQLTQFYESEDMFFHIYLSPKGIYDKEGFSPFWLAYRFKLSDSAEEGTWFPNVTCEFYVKTRENKLYKALSDHGRIAKFGGHCNSLIPRSEIVGRNDSLVPEGGLTLVVKLHWWANNKVPFQTAENVESESNESGQFETQTEIAEIINKELPERVGILKTAEDSGTSVEVTWKIENFFTLPYRQEVGILSPNFKSDDFHGYFAMDPKGSVNTSEFITFRSIVFRGNNRREKIYLQLHLKEKDGTLHKFEAREESRSYFAARVPKSEIEVRKEKMVPGGVLTLLVKLSTTEDDVSSRESSNTHSSKGFTFSTDLPRSTNYPSLASMSNVGILETNQRTDRSWEIKWKLQEFFTLPQYRQLTQSFGSEKFWFHIYMTPKGIYSEADITELQLNWRFKSSSTEDFLFPEFDVQFYLTTKEGKLYSVPEPKCGAAKYGGSCESLIPRREILDRRDSLVHEGDLTVVGKIRWLTGASNTVDSDSENAIKPEAAQESQIVTNKEVSTIERVGELKISRDSSTRVDITWKITDFFTLSFRQDVGILSPNFRSNSFEGYLEMNPKGSVRGSGNIKFTGVILRHDDSRGEMFYKLFLKDKDDVLHEFAVKEEFRNYFSCELPKSTINIRKETMAPGDVVTVVFKISTNKDFDIDSEPAYLPSSTDLPQPTVPSLVNKNATVKIQKIRKNKECDCESVLSSMQKFSSEVLSLYKSGEFSDVSLECGDKKVPAHKSILSARSLVFADMFRSEVGKEAASVDVSDVPFPTMDLMLHYLYSGVLEEMPRDLPEMTALCKAADEYEIESLKSKCLSHLFTLIN